MPILDCPNQERCGGTFTFSPVDEDDTNFHSFEITEQSCACDLTGDEVEALCDQASALPAEAWEPSEP